MPEPGPLVWYQLHPPIPVDVDAARAAIGALAGIGGQPRIVLEVTGRDGRVSWKLGCRPQVHGLVLDALAAHLTGLRWEALPSTLEGLRADMAAGVRLRGGPDLALDHDATEPVTRGLLGALSRTRRAELLHVQLILGPRWRPSLPPDTNDRRPKTIKTVEAGFACEVRIAASTRDPERSRSLIEGVAGALRQLDAPGVHVRMVRASTRAFSGARTPLLWPNRLNISEVVPLTGWPIASRHAAPLPGVPSPHPRLLPPTADVPRTGRPLGVATADKDRPIAISAKDSRQHLWLIGPTGSGKSTLAAQLALSDVAAKCPRRGLVVIDPKGDVVDAIAARADGSRLDDIVILDPRDGSPVGINPLATPRDPDLTADVLLAMFHSLYADAWGPRLHDVLHASLLTLARRGDASLAMLPLLLTNAGFRRSVVGRVSKADPMGLGGFWAWWDGISEAERQQAAAPLMRRLRPILMRPGIRGVLGQRRPKFDLDDVFTKGRILLVSLPKGVIGPEAADLLGSVVVSQLHMRALGQAAIPESKRRPVMLIADELQDFLRLPGDFGDALAQLRSMNVSITAAHQHLDQLPKSLQMALVANARTKVAFGLTGHDAREFAALTRGALSPEDFETLPAFHSYAQILNRNSPGPWVSLATRPLGPPLGDPAVVRVRSSARYGQPLDEIEADLLALAGAARPADEPLGRTRNQGDPRTTEGGLS